MLTARSPTAWSHCCSLRAHITDIFLPSKVANTCELMPEKVASGRNAGFMAEWTVRSETNSPKSNVLTGITLYLQGVAENSWLDPEICRTQNLRLMHHNVMLDRSGYQNKVLHGKVTTNPLSLQILE